MKNKFKDFQDSALEFMTEEIEDRVMPDGQIVKVKKRTWRTSEQPLELGSLKKPKLTKIKQIRWRIAEKRQTKGGGLPSWKDLFEDG